MDEKQIAELDEQFAKRIVSECNSGDREMDHIRGDDYVIQLLRAIGCDKTADAWEEFESEWWYA